MSNDAKEGMDGRVSSRNLFGGFFVQARRGNDDQWTTLGKVEKTRKLAKRHARAHMDGCRAAFQPRCEYRLIINDEWWTIDQESKPPHGWRMRWENKPGATAIVA